MSALRYLLHEQINPNRSRPRRRDRVRELQEKQMRRLQLLLLSGTLILLANAFVVMLLK